MKEVFKIERIYWYIFSFYSYLLDFCIFGLIVENIWALIIFISFVLAVFITVFIKQESRIDELEKKMEELLNNKKD